jgi:hypothetical protein
VLFSIEKVTIKIILVDAVINTGETRGETTYKLPCFRSGSWKLKMILWCFLHSFEMEPGAFLCKKKMLGADYPEEIEVFSGGNR